MGMNLFCTSEISVCAALLAAALFIENSFDPSNLSSGCEMSFVAYIPNKVSFISFPVTVSALRHGSNLVFGAFSQSYSLLQCL